MAVVRVAQHPSSSDSSPRSTYDVFLSFRGKDTRKTFADHLYRAFVGKGFRIFRDDSEMERGEDIEQELEKAIQQSKCSVIVVSKDYTSSKWCLEELFMILERKRTSDHVVLPVFYDIGPSQLRKQARSLAEAFARYRKVQSSNKVQEWMAALTEVTNLAGMILQNKADGYESKFIDKIVTVIGDKLRRTPLGLTPNMVGIHSRAKNINLWLRDGSIDVGILLIFGMRGIGKTMIAKFVYNLNFGRFEGSSYLENINEVSKLPDGLVQIQRQLVHDILNGRKGKIHGISEGVAKIELAISSKRVLIVLDDVDHMDQLHAVFMRKNQFYPGSKIIITTRRSTLSKDPQVTKVHNVETLDYVESLELFSWHAFGQNHPIDGYMELSKKVVSHSGGLPLALRVLGSSLVGESKAVWESALQKLESIPHSEIMNKLRISYDSLQDDHDQKLFLHIACFFVGKNQGYIGRVLDGCEFQTAIGVQNLVDRCLVTIDVNENVEMHEMLREMGRRIVRLESPEEPGRRSRLWRHKDSLTVLKEKSGTETVEALLLTMSMRANALIDLNDRVFFFFLLSHVQLNGSYGEFPTGLRWLCWVAFPLDSIPNDFTLENLVFLEMQYSSLRQMWNGTKFLPSLKMLDVSHSHDLTKTADFSLCPNLETLILVGCRSLIDVHESIGNLKRLVYLNMKDCESIRMLPNTISRLKVLETLIISGCSNLNESSMKIMRSMESLKVFEAKRIPVIILLSPNNHIIASQ